MSLPRVSAWQPSGKPYWLYRRRIAKRGRLMMNDASHVPPSPLSPDDWLNAMWIATRVMGILGHPPVIMGFEPEGTPEIVWIDPEDDSVACVLDFKIDVNQPTNSKLCLHISDNISEGGTLALVGLCTMRNADWDTIAVADSSDENPSPDTKPIF